MAGGKLSARQKMINLMYLVFIAMLALNMSKEVLTAFGLMTEKLEDSTKLTADRNTAFLESLATKAAEAPEKFKELNDNANQIKKLTSDFYTYIDGLKTGAITDGKLEIDPKTGKLPFEIMDKPDHFDEKFFIGDKLKDEGQQFLDNITKFRDGVVALIGDDYKEIAKDVTNEFALADVENKDGNVLSWIDYHYKGFPLVASMTNLTQLQADARNTESKVLSAMLAGKQTLELSMSNYTTLLETPKSAYFNGERFDGEIVLGRKDSSTRPNKVELTLDGRKLTDKEYTIEDGKVKLNVSSGRPGEHKIKGTLIFTQDGVDTPVEVDQKFATIPKPNAATISADKMNVVYRGVTNPMTISFAGIPDNKVTASGTGLSKGSGVGKYNMNPGQGREVTIRVSGKLPDGQPVSDNRTFRIKGIPKPTGTIRGEDGSVKMQRNALEISTVGAKLEDFDFDLPLKISGFKFKVLGQPTISVSGSKLNARAKAALRKAKRGSSVQIFDINAKIKGNSSYLLKKVSPVIIELTN